MQKQIITFIFLVNVIITAIGQTNFTENAPAPKVPDTGYYAILPEFTFSVPALFRNNDEYQKLQKYIRYAYKVYPYAVKAVQTYKEIQQVANEKGRRDEKKYIKELQDKLKNEFEEPLRNLTRTQGKILIKMIEHKLNTPMYTVLKETKGGFTASYWNMMGSMFGYKLKDGYEKGEDTMMDYVVWRFPIPD